MSSSAAELEEGAAGEGIQVSTGCCCFLWFSCPLACLCQRPTSPKTGQGQEGLEEPRGVDLHDGPDELTCAICLEQVEPLDLAIIKGCEHLYHGELWR